jgi:hypothetical protein
MKRARPNTFTYLAILYALSWTTIWPQGTPTLRLKPIKSTLRHMSLSTAFLNELKHNFQAKNFIETGTGRGHTTYRAQRFFDVYTIEIDKKLAAGCKKRFYDSPRVHLYWGSSIDILPRLLSGIEGKAIFWLDGHNSPGMNSSDTNTPLLRELSIIKESGIHDAVILVDDIRCSLWSTRNWQELVRRHGPQAQSLYDMIGSGWPSLSDIINALRAINPNYAITLAGDILIAFDKNEKVAVAPELNALLASVTADFTAAPSDDIIQAENIIASADDQAFSCIKQYVEIQSRYEQPWYHPHLHLWYGLMLLHRKEYKKASEQLSYAQEGGLTHWRVNWYLAQALINQKEISKAQALLARVIEQAPTFSRAKLLLEKINSSMQA